jgi:hypothetical protein
MSEAALGSTSAVAPQQSQIRKAAAWVWPDPAAGDIGVQALDPVRQAVALEEFQRPIDRRRLGGAAAGVEPGQEVIGLHRLAGAQQHFQRTTPRLGQPLVLGRAASLGGLQLSLQPGAGEARLVMHMGAVRAHPELR